MVKKKKNSGGRVIGILEEPLHRYQVGLKDAIPFGGHKKSLYKAVVALLGAGMRYTITSTGTTYICNKRDTTTARTNTKSRTKTHKHTKHTSGP